LVADRAQPLGDELGWADHRARPQDLVVSDARQPVGPERLALGRAGARPAEAQARDLGLARAESQERGLALLARLALGRRRVDGNAQVHGRRAGVAGLAPGV